MRSEATSALLRKWLPLGAERPGATARLFCLPHAGGSAGAYRGWVNALGPAWEVCPLEPPGRASRFREPPFLRIEQFLADLEQVMRALADKPFAFFGHSLGALIAFALAQKLGRAGGPSPVAVVLSGHSVRDLADRTHELSTPEFIAHLQKYEGMPPEVLANDELLELVLPTLRADFEAANTYTHDLGHRLRCPILALGGRTDPEVAEESLASWAELTTGVFTLQMFTGGHFYLREHERETLAAIARFLATARH